jgi:hypothetical protein
MICLCSCSRTPERIISQAWGLRISKYDPQVELFRDEQFPNGDVVTEVRMKVALTKKDIDKLIGKGAKRLPITENPSIVEWLEEISGINNANNGIYYYEEDEKDIVCRVLIYDEETQILYYYLSVI